LLFITTFCWQKQQQRQHLTSPNMGFLNKSSKYIMGGRETNKKVNVSTSVMLALFTVIFAFVSIISTLCFATNCTQNYNGNYMISWSFTDSNATQVNETYISPTGSIFTTTIWNRASDPNRTNITYINKASGTYIYDVSKNVSGTIYTIQQWQCIRVDACKNTIKAFVFDKDNKQISNAKVTLSCDYLSTSKTANTNENGMVEFTGVPASYYSNTNCNLSVNYTGWVTTKTFLIHQGKCGVVYDYTFALSYTDAQVYLSVLKLEDGFYKPMPNLTIRMVGTNNQIYVEKTDQYGAILKTILSGTYNVKIIQKGIILKEFTLPALSYRQNYSQEIVLTDYQYNTDDSRDVGCSQKPCNAIIITPVLSNIVAKSGTSNQVKLRVENLENVDMEFYITFDSPASKFFTQQQKKYTVNANSINIFALSYSVPKQVVTGSYELGIKAQYDCYCSQTSKVVFDIEQVIQKVKLPDEGIDLYDSVVCFGKTKTHKLTITNNDFESKTYSFSADGIPLSWITINPAQQTIATNSYANVSVVLRIPESATEGNYNLGIRAKSKDGDEKYFSAEFFAKNCKEPTLAELFKVSMPEKIEVNQGQNKSFVVEIENLDKVAHTFQISFSGVSDQWIVGDKFKQAESFSKTTSVFTIAVPDLNLSNFTRDVGVFVKDEKNRVVFTKTFNLAVSKTSIVNETKANQTISSGSISGFFTSVDEKKGILGLIFIIIIAAVAAVIYYKQLKGKGLLNNSRDATFAKINTDTQNTKQNIDYILNGTLNSDVGGKFEK